jgi:hypothetical protein
MRRRIRSGADERIDSGRITLVRWSIAREAVFLDHADPEGEHSGRQWPRGGRVAIDRLRICA